MARSRSRPPSQTFPTSESGTGTPPGPTLSTATLPRVWQGVGYRPLPDGAQARPLFDFAAVAFPGATAFAWGAWIAGDRGETLVGALVAERSGTTAFLHGPVVRAEAGVQDAVEVAAQLVAAAIDHASALGALTLYARPQGLDRVWVRFGFIPVPEVALPAALAGRPGVGLYAWRGGSALWTLREAANE